jgi:hypothetical protein
VNQCVASIGGTERSGSIRKLRPGDDGSGTNIAGESRVAKRPIRVALFMPVLNKPNGIAFVIKRIKKVIKLYTLPRYCSSCNLNAWG